MLQIQYENKEWAPSQFSLHLDNKINDYTPDNRIVLPNAIGTGNIKMSQVNEGIFIGESAFVFHKSYQLVESYRKSPSFQLCFCLEGQASWQYLESSTKELSLQTGQVCAQYGQQKESISQFFAGQHCKSFTILLEHSRFIKMLEGYLNNLCLGNKIPVLSSNTSTVSPELFQIIKQMTECRVNDNLRPLYMEGKIMELLAVYLNELFYQKSDALPTSITHEDYLQLKLAKKLIEENVGKSFTIANLAREIYLNEYKLKSGFKHCFGYTVYGYVVHVKMEAAHKLLLTGRYKVKDVAWRVGYSNISHFITAYKRKYGITPKEASHPI